MSDDGDTSDTPDPIDAEAAAIDPRSTEAAEDVDELIEHAEDLGREPEQDVDPDLPER